jgi:hypothetical protein
MTGEMLRSMRRQGANDGRAASTRIDRLEQVIRRQCITLAKAIGPDQLRDRLGAELALQVLEDAGADTTRISERWASERSEREGSAPKQVSTTRNDLDADPRHDERVTAAIMRGASGDELSRILKQVTAEYRERITREAAEGTNRVNFMWIDSRTGRPQYGNSTPVGLGVATDHDGNPRQRSLVNGSVPELGSEPVGEVSMADVRPVDMTCSEHSGQPGDRYCSVCGRPRA